MGMLILHPATMVIYWFEFRTDPDDLMALLLHAVAASATPRMLVMNGLFAILGAGIGGTFSVYHRVLSSKERALGSLRDILAADVGTLIQGGEGEQTEFKATARWDLRQQRVNKALEHALVRGIAGFLNHRGGSLLVGVSDSGEIVGLESDYRTLKQKNRDGFEQFVMSVVKRRLGGQACEFVHPAFVRMGRVDLCRVIVEPCERPVYFADDDGARYYLRTGNATRELDVQEAVEHIRLRELSQGGR